MKGAAKAEILRRNQMMAGWAWIIVIICTTIACFVWNVIAGCICLAFWALVFIYGLRLCNKLTEKEL